MVQTVSHTKLRRFCFSFIKHAVRRKSEGGSKPMQKKCTAIHRKSDVPLKYKQVLQRSMKSDNKVLLKYF